MEGVEGQEKYLCIDSDLNFFRNLANPYPFTYKPCSAKLFFCHQFPDFIMSSIAVLKNKGKPC